MKSRPHVRAVHGLDSLPRVAVDGTARNHVCADVSNRIPHPPAATGTGDRDCLIEITGASRVESDEWNGCEICSFVFYVGIVVPLAGDNGLLRHCRWAVERHPFTGTNRIESRRQVSQRGTRDEATSRHGASVEGADTVFTLGQREALVYPQGMDPEIGADVALFRALSLAARQLNAAVEQRLQNAASISLPEFEILSALRAAPDNKVRAGELGVMLAWEKSRTSHQVARMQRRGLVSRATCHDDLRGTWVGITDAGWDAIAAATPAYREAVEAQLSGVIGTDDADAIARLALQVSRRVAPESCHSEVSVLERSLGLIAR